MTYSEAMKIVDGLLPSHLTHMFEEFVSLAEQAQNEDRARELVRDAIRDSSH